ncbi:MAG: TolC family protein [Chitinophagaceae bacterium]
MKRPIICLFLTLSFVQILLAQEKWDLKRCVEYAIANNISVKQADLQSRFSALQLQQNKLSAYPNLNLQTNAGYRFGRSENPATGILEDNNFFNTGFGLQSNVSLFDWFSKKYSIHASRLEHEADLAQVKKVQDDVALNVAVAYLQALLAKEQINISAVQVDQTRAQLEVTRKRVNAGALPELNAAELEAQLARDSSTYVSAQSNLQQLLLQLKAVLNLDAAAPFDIEAPPVEMIPLENLADLQPEVVYQSALQNLPLQKVNKLRMQSNEEVVKAARAGMYPSISAYASLGSNYVNIGFPEFLPGPKETTGATVFVNGIEYQVLRPGIVPTGREIQTPLGRQFQNNFGQNVGLSLNVPIFNGGELRTNWERSKLNVRQSQLQIENDNQVLKQDIYSAYTDAVAAIQKFNASRKSVEAAQKAYDFAQKRYDVNLTSTFELLNSQNNLLRARIEMLSAQFDYVFKLKLLEFYKGQGMKL